MTVSTFLRFRPIYCKYEDGTEFEGTAAEDHLPSLWYVGVPGVNVYARPLWFFVAGDRQNGWDQQTVAIVFDWDPHVGTGQPPHFVYLSGTLLNWKARFEGRHGRLADQSEASLDEYSETFIEIVQTRLGAMPVTYAGGGGWISPWHAITVNGDNSATGTKGLELWQSITTGTTSGLELRAKWDLEFGTPPPGEFGGGGGSDTALLEEIRDILSESKTILTSISGSVSATATNTAGIRLDLDQLTDVVEDGITEVVAAINNSSEDNGETPTIPTIEAPAQLEWLSQNNVWKHRFDKDNPVNTLQTEEFEEPNYPSSWTLNLSSITPGLDLGLSALTINFAPFATIVQAIHLIISLFTVIWCMSRIFDEFRRM